MTALIGSLYYASVLHCLVSRYNFKIQQDFPTLNTKSVFILCSLGCYVCLRTLVTELKLNKIPSNISLKVERILKQHEKTAPLHTSMGRCMQIRLLQYGGLHFEAYISRLATRGLQLEAYNSRLTRDGSSGGGVGEGDPPPNNFLTSSLIR